MVAVPVLTVNVQDDVASSLLKTVPVLPDRMTLFRSSSNACCTSRGVVPPSDVDKRLEAALRSPAADRNAAPSTVTPEYWAALMLSIPSVTPEYEAVRIEFVSMPRVLISTDTPE